MKTFLSCLTLTTIRDENKFRKYSDIDMYVCVNVMYVYVMYIYVNVYMQGIKYSLLFRYYFSDYFSKISCLF